MPRVRTPHDLIDSPALHRLRVRWAAIGAAVAVTLGAGTIATVDAVKDDGERLVFVAGDPCRLMNTRPGTNQVGPRVTPLPAGIPITVDARGAEGNCTAAQLPDDAVALQLNVTPVNATAPTDITIWPSGPIPQASSVNPRPGVVTPNAVVATLASNGTFLMQNKFGTIDMVIDVLGYFVDHTHDDRYGPPDSIEIGPHEMRREFGASWSLNGAGVWSHTGSTTACLVFPLDPVPGQAVESITAVARKNSATLPTVEVSVEGHLTTAEGSTNGNLRQTIARTESRTIVGANDVVVDVVADEGGIGTILDDYAYHGRVCATGNMQLYAARVALSGP